MEAVAYSFAAGACLGVLFTLFKLPLPAPNALAGVIGIFGVYAGMKAVEWVNFLKGLF